MDKALLQTQGKGVTGAENITTVDGFFSLTIFVQFLLLLLLVLFVSFTIFTIVNSKISLPV